MNNYLVSQKITKSFFCYKFLSYQFYFISVFISCFFIGAVYGDKLTNIAIANSACFNLNGANIGSILKSQKCSEQESQKFILRDATIRSQLNIGMCLTVSAPKKGASIFLWPCENKNNLQKFSLKSSGLRLLQFNDICVSKSTNNSIVLAKCDESVSQLVSIQVSIKTEDSKCFDIFNKEAEQVLVHRNCRQKASQLFYFNGQQIRPSNDLTSCIDSFVDWGYLKNTENHKGNTKVFIKKCTKRDNPHQQYTFDNRQIKRRDNNWCLNNFKGVKFGAIDPVILDRCDNSMASQIYSFVIPDLVELKDVS